MQQVSLRQASADLPASWIGVQFQDNWRSFVAAAQALLAETLAANQPSRALSSSKAAQNGNMKYKTRKISSDASNSSFWNCDSAMQHRRLEHAKAAGCMAQEAEQGRRDEDHQNHDEIDRRIGGQQGVHGERAAVESSTPMPI